MHRVQNYGSALQAYALQEYINRLGYDAELIDYIFPNKKHKQHRPLKKRIKSTLFKWAFCLPLLRKSKRFARFYKTYYKCSKAQFDSPESLMQYDYPYDILMTGSDQVWNPIHILTDTSFFLTFAKKHDTYEISTFKQKHAGMSTAERGKHLVQFGETCANCGIHETAQHRQCSGTVPAALCQSKHHQARSERT